MRVILDTNVPLSGLLIGNGPPARLLECWERGLFTLVICEELISEFRHVAVRSFFAQRLRGSAVEELAAELRNLALFVGTVSYPEFPADPKDSFLLGLAEAGQADYLVTGDKALQSLERHRDTRILSPAAAAALFRDRSSSRLVKRPV